MKTQKNEQRRFNPLNDFLFYKVMGEKGDEPQLAGFLNAVLGPSGRKPIASLEILENNTFVANVLKGKSCTLDLSAVLEDGSRANIEVQLRDNRDMDRRSLFYWSKLYTRGARRGQHYGKLPDVIAVNIVGFDFPPKGGFHTRFRLLETSDPSIELTGAMEIHFVNMVRWRRLKGKDLAGNPLHRWAAWLDPKSPPELVEEVKRMDSAIAAAAGRQDFVLGDEKSLALYEMRQKVEWDRASELATAKEKGEQRGERRGRQEGRVEIARNALAKGYSLEQIHEITGLDLKTIARLKAGG